MKLRNVDLRGSRNHRLEEHGKDKAKTGQQGLHITNSNSRTFSYHDALLSCLRFGRDGFYSERAIDVETFSFADAHRGDGKRFIVHADEKLRTASATRESFRSGIALAATKRLLPFGLHVAIREKRISVT